MDKCAERERDLASTGSLPEFSQGQAEVKGMEFQVSIWVARFQTLVSSGSVLGGQD